MVSNTETDETLKIRVMNVSRKSWARCSASSKGVPGINPLFKAIYEQEFGQLGGHPYGALVGDYEFDHSPRM